MVSEHGDAFRQIRKEYGQGGLVEENAPAEPLPLFTIWLEEAVKAGLVEPNGMTLATATPDGRPSARVVLLKDVDARGFVFFTNFDSRKGRELAENPRAALVFWWTVLERQIRIEGEVARLPEAESDAYFHTRPRGAQLGAWVSPQSDVIASRRVLVERQAALRAEYRAGLEIPRPPHWGGYRLVPDAFEFWQGRPDRLHDRLRYRRLKKGRWRRERLAP